VFCWNTEAPSVPQKEMKIANKPKVTKVFIILKLISRKIWKIEIYCITVWKSSWLESE
jgi:hypothetical protein